MKKALLKFASENSLLKKDIIAISDYMKSKDDSKVDAKQDASEKNKAFTVLMNQMRKATRIMSVLEKRMNNYNA